jgi:hypothetical protein
VAHLGDGRPFVGHAVIGSNTFFDENGQSYVVTAGIYGAVRQEDGSWLDQLLLERAETTGRIAAAFRAGQGAMIAFRDDGNAQLLLYTSFDNGGSWQASAIEQSAGTGKDPSLGFLSDGTLIAAYAHCTDDNTGGDTCSAAQDGVRIAARAANATQFTRFTFRGDSEDADGIFPNMAIAADDTIAVASFSSSGNIVVQRFRKQ